MPKPIFGPWDAFSGWKPPQLPPTEALFGDNKDESAFAERCLFWALEHRDQPMPEEMYLDYIERMKQIVEDSPAGSRRIAARQRRRKRHWKRLARFETVNYYFHQKQSLTDSIRRAAKALNIKSVTVRNDYRAYRRERGLALGRSILLGKDVTPDRLPFGPSVSDLRRAGV